MAHVIPFPIPFREVYNLCYITVAVDPSSKALSYRVAACDVTDLELLLISMENLHSHGKKRLRRTAQSRSILSSLDVERTMVIHTINDLW